MVVAMVNVNAVSQPEASVMVMLCGPGAALIKSSVVSPLSQTKAYGAEPFEAVTSMKPLAALQVDCVTVADAVGMVLGSTVVLCVAVQLLLSVSVTE